MAEAKDETVAVVSNPQVFSTPSKTSPNTTESDISSRALESKLSNTSSGGKFDFLFILGIAFEFFYSQKSNLHCTVGITPKRATSVEAHLRGLAPGQHSFEKISQW